MANVTIKFEHAIWDTFTYQRGARLHPNEDALKILLKSADAADKRSPKYFFEVLDDKFIFGFENQRHDKHSRRGTSAFFDLYAAPANEARVADFSKLFEFFSKCRIDTYTADIAPAVTYQEQDHTIGKATNGECDDDSALAADKRAENDGPPTGGDSMDVEEGEEPRQTPEANQSDGVDDTTIQTIADIWEHRRRANEEKPVLTTFKEAVTLIETVQGALSRISFVSSYQGDPSYFTLVEGQREESLSYNLLEAYLQHLAESNDLCWEQLPSYRDEIKEVRSLQEEKLVENSRERYKSSVDEALRMAQTEMETVVNHHLENVQDIFSQAVHEELEPREESPGDGNFVGRVSGRVGGIFSRSDHSANEETYIDQAVNQYRERIDDKDITVDDQTERAIVEHIIQRIAAEVVETIEEDVTQVLEKELREAVEQESITLAVETAKRTDKIRRTKSYKLAQQGISNSDSDTG